MKKGNIIRSIGAILGGFITGAALSLGTDMVLNVVGFLNLEAFNQSTWWIILVVIIYRFIYNVIGCYVASALAPNKPMMHAMIIGIIGTLLSILGSFMVWDNSLIWYNLSIIFISLPSAYVGGKIFVAKSKSSAG